MAIWGWPTVDVLLGLTPRCTLEHVLSGERALEEVILADRRPACAWCRRPRAWRAWRLLSATEQAGIVQAFSTLPGPLDVLIVDTAAGIGESVLQFCQAAQQVLVVLRDEPTSLTDTYALIKVLSRDHGVRQFRVRRQHDARTRRRGRCAFRRLQRVTDRYLEVVLDYVGEIPEDISLQKSVQAQRAGARGVSELPGGAGLSRRWRARPSSWPLPAGPSGRLEFFMERMLTRPAPRLRCSNEQRRARLRQQRSRRRTWTRWCASTPIWSSASPITWPGACRRRWRSRI